MLRWDDGGFKLGASCSKEEVEREGKLMLNQTFAETNNTVIGAKSTAMHPK